MCCGGLLVEVEAFALCRWTDCCCFCSPTPLDTNKRVCFANNDAAFFASHVSINDVVICNNTVIGLDQVVPTVASSSTSPTTAATTPQSASITSSTTTASSSTTTASGSNGQDSSSSESDIMEIVVILGLLALIGAILACMLYYCFVVRSRRRLNDATSSKRTSHSSGRSRRSTYSGAVLSRSPSRQVLGAPSVFGGNVYAYDRVSSVAEQEPPATQYWSSAYGSVPVHSAYSPLPQHAAAQGAGRVYQLAPPVALYQSPPPPWANSHDTTVIKVTSPQAQGGQTTFVRR